MAEQDDIEEQFNLKWLGTDRIIRNALFTDGTMEYRIPVEADPGEIVCFRFRTAKGNVDEVHMVLNGTDLTMTIADHAGYFDYYELRRKVEVVYNHYYFYVVRRRGIEKEICYYTAVGPTDYVNEQELFCFTLGFHTPAWAKGAIFYQIFVERFYNGDPGNDVQDNEYIYIGEPVQEINQWQKYPASMGVREFYGGDLLGIIKKLDYLQELGVQVLYLNPVFVSPSNHKYDIQDYDNVDPHYGVIINDCPNHEQAPASNREASQYIKRVTDPVNLMESNKMLARLSAEVHKRGMRLILDGVFNHCGSFNKWLDREGIYENAEGYEAGAYVDENSMYRSFFHFYQEEWPYNGSYEGWWGHDTLPKLNYEDSPELNEYIMYIARKWVSAPYYIDGWRLDVAADLGRSEEFNHKFWRKFRKNVRMANPEVLILAEHYGDASEWLKGDQWDSVMNYDAFMEPISWFLTGMEKHSDESRPDLRGNDKHFIYCMNKYMARFQSQSLMTAMNELSNHDHSRWLTRTNRMVGRIGSLGPQAACDNVDYGIYRIGVVMQFTWIGAPTIYYGDEAGLCGWTDPDNRRTYPWGYENQEFIHLHKELCTIHKWYGALQTGSIKIIYGEQDVIVYGRFDGVDKFIIAVNISANEKWVSIPVWEIGIMDNERVATLISTTSEGFGREAVMYEVKNGMLHLSLKPVSSLVLKNHIMERP